jgi:hypothetical protein
MLEQIATDRARFPLTTMVRERTDALVVQGDLAIKPVADMANLKP